MGVFAEPYLRFVACYVTLGIALCVLAYGMRPLAEPPAIANAELATDAYLVGCLRGVLDDAVRVGS